MAQKYSQIIKKLGENRTRENRLLAEYTTFHIGGPADLFYEAKTTKEIISTVKFCRQLEVPYFILGGGSNLLISDQGFRGLVLKVQSTTCKISKNKIIAEAGMSLARIIEIAADYSLSGLEFCAGIPGTIGGAVVGNSGTKDRSIGDLIEKVRILNEEGKVAVLAHPDCQFDYRSSRFQKKTAIIIEVTLVLNRGNKQTINNKISRYLTERKRQPKEPSAGSIFKNPPGKSAGKLIEEAGLKGKVIGQAQISKKHANWIVNLDGARCQDVLELLTLAKSKVRTKFDIELEEEIQIIDEVQI